jgi:hypothetical protein
MQCNARVNNDMRTWGVEERNWEEVCSQLDA